VTGVCATGLCFSKNIFWIYFAGTVIFLSGVFHISMMSHQTFHRIVIRLFERHNILSIDDNFINDVIEGLPVVSTYIEVFDGNVQWRYLQKPTIWRETKDFEYAHCIDITDRNAMNFSKHFATKINLQVQFADNETEHAYKEHVDVLLNELPDYCRNGEATAQKRVEIPGKSKTGLLIRGKEILKYALSIFPLSLVTLPVFYVMITSGLLCKLCHKFTIKKEITSKRNLKIMI